MTVETFEELSVETLRALCVHYRDALQAIWRGKPNSWECDAGCDDTAASALEEATKMIASARAPRASVVGVRIEPAEIPAEATAKEVVPLCRACGHGLFVGHAFDVDRLDGTRSYAMKCNIFGCECTGFAWFGDPVRELLEGFLKYGNHKYTCRVLRPFKQGACDCGFRAMAFAANRALDPDHTGQRDCRCYHCVLERTSPESP